MTEVIRKNEMQITAVFEPIPGQVGTPSAAEVVLVYTNTSGAEQTDNVQMGANTDGSWSATWDSSACKSGEVEWMAHCWGGLIASTQGTFRVKANRANKI